LFRHRKLGSRPLEAILKVRSGELSAHTALLDYDAKGWSPRHERSSSKTDRLERDRKARARKAKTPKSKAKSKALRSSSTTLTPVKPLSARAVKRQFRGAEEAQNAVGAMVLKLSAIKAEFSKDEALVQLIEGITQVVAKPHHELKRTVLLRATKVNSTPRRAT
jgi:hypothetical protein